MTDFLPGAEPAATAPAAANPQIPALAGPLDGMESTGQEQPGRGKTRPAVEIVVRGIPAPQGSKKHVGRGVMVESSKKVEPWREAVKTAAYADDPLRLDGPLLVEMVFTFVRPKGHYRTGRNAHLLRGSAPAHPAVIPDLSKLIRSTEDALTEAGVWADDARVVRFKDPRKVYADSSDPDALPVAGAVIRVWEVTA